MSEKPILFNTEMVKAVLAGRKTQTRRIIKDLPDDFPNGVSSDVVIRKVGDFWCLPTSRGYKKSPYGGRGDTVWVRETHWIDWYANGVLDANGKPGCVHYRANHPYPIISKSIDGQWRPSIFMPRWASRITLQITHVRVEQVQDITEADAEAEGVTVPLIESKRVTHSDYHTARMQFMGLWDSINAKRGYSWESNPWVWVVEFEVIP